MLRPWREDGRHWRKQWRGGAGRGALGAGCCAPRALPRGVAAKRRGASMSAALVESVNGTAQVVATRKPTSSESAQNACVSARVNGLFGQLRGVLLEDGEKAVGAVGGVLPAVEREVQKLRAWCRERGQKALVARKARAWRQDHSHHHLATQHHSQAGP